MNIIRKAFRWGLVAEIALIVPIAFAWWASPLFDHFHLRWLEVPFGALDYLALYCHVPAIYLLRHWSATQGPLGIGTWAILMLTQGCLWSIAFTLVFTLQYLLRKPKPDPERSGA